MKLEDNETSANDVIMKPVDRINNMIRWLFDSLVRNAGYMMGACLNISSLRVSLSTLRRMELHERLGSLRTPGGHRRYTLTMLNACLSPSDTRGPLRSKSASARRGGQSRDTLCRYSELSMFRRGGSGQ